MKTSLVQILDNGKCYSQRYLHFSVSTGRTREHWCILGRVRVTFNLKDGSWYCGCSKSGRKSCLHRVVAKRYAHEHIPDILKKTVPSGSFNVPNEDETNTSVGTGGGYSCNQLEITDTKALKQSVQYLRSSKRYLFQFQIH